MHDHRNVKTLIPFSQISCVSQSRQYLRIIHLNHPLEFLNTKRRIHQGRQKCLKKPSTSCYLTIYYVISNFKIRLRTSCTYASQVHVVLLFNLSKRIYFHFLFSVVGHFKSIFMFQNKHIYYVKTLFFYLKSFLTLTSVTFLLVISSITNLLKDQWILRQTCVTWVTDGPQNICLTKSFFGVSRSLCQFLRNEMVWQWLHSVSWNCRQVTATLWLQNALLRLHPCLTLNTRHL